MQLFSNEVSLTILKLLNGAGKLSNEEVELYKDEKDPLSALIEKKVVSEQELVQGLSSIYKTPIFQEFNLDKADEKAMSVIPAKQLIKLKVIPYSFEKSQLLVLLVDPSNSVSVGQISALSGRKSIVKLVTISQYQALLDKITDQIPEQEAEVKQVEVKKNTSGSRRSTRKKEEVFDTEDASQVRTFVNSILQTAAKLDASDIHIEIYQHGARVRFRMNGILEIMTKFNEYLNAHFNACVARLKLMGDCDISERRLAQDGALNFSFGSESIDVRFSSLPTKFGESIVMRLLRGEATLELDQIGFLEHDYDILTKAITSPQGMVLVTGPTGSGKTTTLYACLQSINTPEKNIMTAEDPIEYTLDGVRQSQAREDIGLSFSNILRAFLRQDPEIILVGEIRDKETADIAIKAALTGHLLLSTLHTNSAIATIQRLGNMGIPNFMLATALSVIVAQRLARKNCQKCLVDDEVDQKTLDYIGFESYDQDNLKPKKGKGCPACGGSGYKGRQGIYEVLNMDSNIEGIILEGNFQLSDIENMARQNGFKTMQDVGRDYITKGLISIEEYQRVLSE
jgi:type IV pilus assembly protein PilB